MDGVETSITLVSDCKIGLHFDSGYLWIKSFFDRAPNVSINGQSCEVFYFVKQYNLIGASISESIYQSSRIGGNASLDSSSQLNLNLSVNGRQSDWTVIPQITVKRECFGDFEYDPFDPPVGLISDSMASVPSVINAASLWLLLFVPLLFL
jgi:hypothetical protein